MQSSVYSAKKPRASVTLTAFPARGSTEPFSTNTQSLGVASTSIVALPIVTALSCGAQKEKQKKETQAEIAWHTPRRKDQRNTTSFYDEYTLRRHKLVWGRVSPFTKDIRAKDNNVRAIHGIHKAAMSSV